MRCCFQFEVEVKNGGFGGVLSLRICDSLFLFLLLGVDLVAGVFWFAFDCFFLLLVDSLGLCWLTAFWDGCFDLLCCKLLDFISTS